MELQAHNDAELSEVRDATKPLYVMVMGISSEIIRSTRPPAAWALHRANIVLCRDPGATGYRIIKSRWFTHGPETTLSAGEALELLVHAASTDSTTRR